jgi:hypothetical protein
MYISTLTTPLDKSNREQPKYLAPCTVQTPKEDIEKVKKRKQR